MFEAKTRDSVGSKSARSSRHKGSLPAAIYGGHLPVEHVLLDRKIVSHHYNTDAGFFSKILKIAINGKEENVLAKSIQLHPVTDTLIHAGFMRVSENSKVHVSVPLRFIHEDRCPGIKLGGILNTIVHSLEIICAPHEIPTHIDVTLEGLAIHHTVHLKDLNLGSIRAAHPERDDVIATIVAPVAEVAAE